MFLRLPALLQRPLQVILQPLQRPPQVAVGALHLPLRPLPRLELQLRLEERCLQGQQVTVAPRKCSAAHLE